MSSNASSNVSYAKKLEGIRFTPEIRSLSQAVLDLPQTHSVPRRKTDLVEATEEDNIKRTATQRAVAKIQVDEAKSIVQEQLGRKQKKNHLYFPIVAIRAISSLIQSSTIDSSRKTSLRAKLEESISQSLSFSPLSPLLYTTPLHADNTLEQKKFKKRLEHLRMRSEQQKYVNLTANISSKKRDDVTTRSMTYAASVGLNMIVAPLSFGAFMYFFSGQLFGWVFKDSQQSQDIDVRRVIVAVISGVIMMFIEMILFVIRSYELDKSTTKKEKKKGLEPFGSYVKTKTN